MIDSAEAFKISLVFDPGNKLVYKIPKYQREYSWGQAQWQALIDDILSDDAEGGHFLGTIITINSAKGLVGGASAEVVDGQQRLTTLTLLLLAIYKKLTPLKVANLLDDDQSADYTILRRMLLVGSPTCARLELQTQNNNNDDLLALFTEVGLKYEHVAPPKVKNVGNRKLSKALRFFEQVIDSRIPDNGEPATEILSLLNRVKQSAVVVIQVSSYSDAFVLFESLNYRGVPLSPIDLIKNSYLAISEKKGVAGVDAAYDSWSNWVSLLGDNYKDQERFFRHFYNSLKKFRELNVPGVTIATRTKLIYIYEKLFEADEAKLVGLMDVATVAYQRIINPQPDKKLNQNSVDTALLNLSRIDGTPCHALLLFLLMYQESLHLTDDELISVIDALIAFFVRRNLTNVPSTNGLDRLFMGIVEDLQANGDVSIIEKVLGRLRSVSVSEADFAKALRGPVYDINHKITRYLLVKLAEPNPTKEARDLWARQLMGKDTDKENWLWTIEHIFPQAGKTPTKWVEMAGGPDEAALIYANDVDSLGNLTLSAYNSALGAKSFVEKRDKVDDKGQPIGYKNGLRINEQLANVDVWNRQSIQARTEAMADEVVELFPL